MVLTVFEKICFLNQDDIDILKIQGIPLLGVPTCSFIAHFYSCQISPEQLVIKGIKIACQCKQNMTSRLSPLPLRSNVSLVVFIDRKTKSNIPHIFTQKRPQIAKFYQMERSLSDSAIFHDVILALLLHKCHFSKAISIPSGKLSYSDFYSFLSTSMAKLEWTP